MNHRTTVPALKQVLLKRGYSCRSGISYVSFVFDLVASRVVRHLGMLGEQSSASESHARKPTTVFEESLFIVAGFDICDTELLTQFTAACTTFGREHVRAPKRQTTCFFFPVAIVQRTTKDALNTIRSQEPLIGKHNTLTFPVILHASSGRLCHSRFENITGEDCIWKPIGRIVTEVFRNGA